MVASGNVLASCSFRSNVRKMASDSVVCLFLLCCSAVVSQGCDQLVAVGGDVDVPLGYELKPTDALRWKFNGNIIFFKKRGRIIQGKNDDINDDGSLKLTNLKLDQEGLYTSEVFDGNGRQTSSKSTNLCVLDPVKKPTLNITCLTSEVVFTCSHDPQPDGTKHYDTIHYKWLQNGNLISNATEISMTRKVAETENLLVSCEVGNKVSSATSDSLTHTCIGCDKYAATGRSFNVPLGYKLKSTDTLKWKFNDEVIFNKKPSKILAGKTTDITEDGSLILTNLKKDKEGNYIPEVYNSDGKILKTVKTHLCIRDPVKKPAVEAECKEEENKVIFKCVTDKTPKSEIKKYQWLRNNVQMDKTVPTFKLTAAETKDIKFACNISNDVSFEISEPVTHNCGEISCLGLPGLPDELWGICTWVFLGGGGGIVLLLIIIVIVCCIRTRRTRKLRLKDEEELRLEWTNTSHHPNHPPLPDHPPPHHPNRHHHHHHHQQQQQQQEQQQAPGNTGPRKSRSKQNLQPRARAPEPNAQPQPSPRRTGQAQKPASDADDEQPPPLPQPRKKGPKTQLD